MKVLRSNLANPVSEPSSISVLFLTPSPIRSASERYRIYQFLPDLRRAGFSCTIRPFATEQLHRAIQDERLIGKVFGILPCAVQRARDLTLINRFDAVVIHREAFPFFHPLVEQSVIRRHPRVIFDLDDAIYVGHQDTGKVKYHWAYGFKYGPGINHAFGTCCHVVAGNQVLAAHARKFNENVSVVPTVVDLNQYTYQSPPADGDSITIGWVGSRSTSPYLLEVEGALRRLSQAHVGRIRFVTYGDPKRKLELPNFESLPFSLESEVENLRRCDIGIMPMPENDWTRGKCAFKAIQYMALGIPTVASPVGTATELIRDGENGLLARTESDWFECLDRLVRDSSLRRRLSRAGRDTIEREYSLQVWAPRVIRLFNRIIVDGNRKEAPALERVS